MKKGATIILAAVSALFAGPVFAGEGIPVGNAIFYPSIEVVYFSTDNVFLQSDSSGLKVSDQGWVIRPSIQFDVPFNESFFRFRYMLQYKDYQDFDLDNEVSHHLGLEGNFKSAAGHSLVISDRFVQGVQEVEEFDPGMEVKYGNATFTHNTFNIGGRWMLSRRTRLELDLGHELQEFDDDGQVSFFEWDQWNAAFTWRYHYLPKSNVYVTFGYRDYDMDEMGNMNEYVTGFSRDHQRTEMRLGWNGYLGRNTSAHADLGWAGLHFDGMNPYDDYSGLVGSVSFTADFTHFAKVDAKIFRDAYASAFNVNNYYVASGIALNFNHQANRYFFWSLGASWQQNDYPEVTDSFFDPILWTWAYALEGMERRDDIAKYQAEIGVHILKQLSLRFNYAHTTRDSNVEGFTVYNPLQYMDPIAYDEDRFTFQMQFNW